MEPRHDKNMEKDNKILIELSQWEADQLHEGIRYLIDKHVTNPENFKTIPDATLKAVAWIIAFNTNRLKPKLK